MKVNLIDFLPRLKSIIIIVDLRLNVKYNISEVEIN